VAPSSFGFLCHAVVKHFDGSEEHTVSIFRGTLFQMVAGLLQRKKNVSVRKDSLRGLVNQLWKMGRGISHIQDGGGMFLQDITSFNYYIIHKNKRMPLVGPELSWKPGNIIA
jgi:hypothetical protein